MTEIAVAALPRRTAWGAETRATLSLAWPLVLTNVAQIAIGTTDVAMMGWLGPDALAAGALAINVNYAFLIFAMGVVGATAPMIASQNSFETAAARSNTDGYQHDDTSSDRDPDQRVAVLRSQAG